MRLALALMTVFAATAASAQMPLYNGTELLQEKKTESARQRIITGKNQKSEGRWHFEREQRIEGTLKEQLYRIDGADSLDEITAFYQEWVKTHADRVLFHCKGRECGSSNVWANDFFQERQLYAQDADQRYWALQKGGSYYMLYLVQRGNERIYLHVSHVDPVAAELSPLQLGGDCGHADLADYMRRAENSRPLLLVVSVPGDAGQQQSLSLAVECRKRLQEAYPVTIKTLALGAYDRQLQPVKELRIELLPAPAGKKP